MKNQPEATYRIATFAVALLLGVGFISIDDRLGVSSAGGLAPKPSSTLTRANIIIQKFLQERGKRRADDGSRYTGAEPQNQRPPVATVQGLVIDAQTRQPIGGARVTLARGREPIDITDGGKEPALTGLTNERGRFRLEVVEHGVYRMTASKHGYVLPSFYVIELEAGKTTSREIRLHALVKIAGRVLDESNNPVKEARVRALFDTRQPSAALRRLISERGESALMTTTGRQGEFDLFVPPEEESITLAAVALGYAPSRLGPLPVRAGRARTAIVLLLSRGLEARGRIVDEKGTPIHDAAILANRSGVVEFGPEVSGREPRARSGADGRFVLRGLETASYTLRVSHTGHATSSVPDVEIQPQIANSLPDIVLSPEAQIKGRVIDSENQPIAGASISSVSGEMNTIKAASDENGTFVLKGLGPGANVTLLTTAAGHHEANKVVNAPDLDVVIVLSRHSVLRGRVEDAETLSPIKEFRIRAAAGVEGKWFRSEDGTFEWTGLSPGRWTVVVQSPGYQTTEVAGIEIRPGETTGGVLFSLAKGVELAGRVVDAATGAPLPNVTVDYRFPADAVTPSWDSRFDVNRQTTDSDGNFNFDGLPRGRATIIAGSALYSQTRRTVVAGEERFVEIRLPKGGSVSGRVVGLDGATPLPKAQVTLWDVASMSGVTFPADEAGAFSFTSLAAGRYRLTAEASQGQTKPQEIVLRESERLSDLILVVRAGATIRGKVTGLGSGESRTVDLVAQGGGGFTAMTSSDSDSQYVIQGAPAGRVEVIAQTSLQRIVSKSVEIPDGSVEVTLNIEFPSGARISGRVTRGDKAVAFRTVTASPRDPEASAGSGKTDQNGAYIIDGLSQSDYIISVDGEGTKSLRISGDTVVDLELPPLSLSGRVLDASSGQPLPGVTVQVQGQPSGLREVITGRSGRFLLDGIEPGQYQLIAHKRGFKVITERLSMPASSEPILSLIPAEGITIRVKDGISGLSLRAVTVDALSGGQTVRLNVALDETGSGELPQLNLGRYDLLVSSPGYASKPVIGLTIPRPLLEFSLTPGGSLEISADSTHAAARASLVDSSGIPFRLRQTEFPLSEPVVFTHLAPDEYTLLVKLPEQTKTYKVSIFEGQTTVLKVK